MTTNTRGRVRTEPTEKRIRVMLQGVTVVDTKSAVMVWEVPYFPTYYFPPDDVRMELLTDAGDETRSPSRGTARLHDVTVGDRTAHMAARVWTDGKIDDVRDYVSLDWDAFDHWFEEDEEVYTHARDPYTRLDILPSSRHIRVEVDGVTVADSAHARFLFETNLPTRYYLPKTDVRREYLTSTDLQSRCPYKGTARYWSVTVNGNTHENIVWGYDTPLAESQRIAGLVSFYNEKVDIYVDGELEERPVTKFG
ncbi:MAG: DUF427 domain-containing protein [Acidimicrobiia bacterium]